MINKNTFGCISGGSSFQVVAWNLRSVVGNLSNIKLEVPLAGLVMGAFGCRSSSGLAADQCHWERSLYEDSRNMISADTALQAKFGYSVNGIPVVVQDSAYHFGLEYSDFDVDDKLDRLYQMPDMDGKMTLCRSHQVVGLRSLSTADESRDVISFGRIDSAYRRGYYLITAILYHNAGLRPLTGSVEPFADMVVYFLCYDVGEKRRFVVRSDVLE